MSIKKSFAGKTIRKPGAYSQISVSNSAGSSLGAADILFLVGESSQGAPGSVSGIVSFPAERLNDLISVFGEGPLVDSAVAAARPSKTNGIGGPSTILVYKTNASTQASALIKKSGSSIYQAKGSAWGVGDNGLSIIIAAGDDSARQKLISVAQIGGTTEALGENAAQQVMSIHYTGNATTASMAISGSSQQQKALAVTLAGDQTDSSANLSIMLKNYTMKTLVDFINAQPGYAASLITVSLAQTAATQLDPLAATSILASVNMYQLQYEILAVINGSARVQATIQDPPVVGLPDNSSGIFLAGGAQGASANSDFANGYSVSLAEDYNALLPCASRDASEDVADAVQGFTDASSSYTIASILAAADAHLRLRSDVKNRKEAGGFGGVRKSSKAAAFAAVASVGSEYMQIAIQDCLMIDAEANQSYKHPHVTAAFAAGMRTGMPVGEPLTFKFPAVLDIGHFINPATGLSAGDFNPGVDFDAAIDAGVLFMEKANGGFRWVVDNTSYGIDDSFVFNRGSVMSAVFFVNKSLRQVAETIFVGHKVSNGAASSIKNAVRNKLRELNQPDTNIITSSSDAPEGFREDTFVVTIQGNTAIVQVEYKPVQGLDFVFFEFTLGDIQQTA